MRGVALSRSALFDVAVAAVALAASLALAAGSGRAQPGTRPLDGWAYGLVVVSCGVLVARRRHPLPVAGVPGMALAVFAVRDYPGGPLVVAVMVALYTVGVRLGRRSALAAGAVAVVLVAARSAALLAAHGTSSAFTWAAPGWVVACLLAGMVVRTRREALQAVRDRADQAERTREQEAQARVAQERLRIARDLHDVVGHSFTAVNVQARAAVALLDTDPGAARQAMAAVESISRDALREIRATLGALRRVGTGGERLPGLLAAARAAGLVVDARVDDVPPVLEEVVYRIVQESLTNVVRHARATTVTVAVVADREAVRVEVRDDGGGPSVPDGVREPGQGLAGMHERVAAVGGRLTCGPVDGGGWQVAARLPVRG